MTTKETYNEIVEEVQSKAEFEDLLPENDNSTKLLADYSSKSKVDPWRGIAWVIASIISAFRLDFDKFKEDTGVEARNNRIGTADWWLASAYAFQYGDFVEVISGKTNYAVIDEAKQIITNASHQVNAGINLVKCVKGEFPDFEPLSAAEASSLRSYYKRIAPPGISYAVISSVAEEIKIVANVYYNGNKDIATVTANVEAAIEDYIKYLPVEGENNIFNGTLVQNELIDKVRSIEGVNDFQLTEILISVDGQDKVPGRTYQPLSGWLRMKDGFPLSNTLTYYATNV